VKNILYKALGVLAFVLTLVAQTNAANACIVHFYEPDLPEALRE
jgi:cyclic lactone autoinducer peptide